MTNTDPSTPVVPGYRTVALLGAGAHGEVWLGHDLDTDEPVALKVRRGLRPVLAEDERAGGHDADAAAALAREVAVLRRLRHRHVIGLRSVVDLPGGGRAMVLDHAAGGSLTALVQRRGPLSAAEASTVLVPLARTLADLHRQGLVHGDLAPGNVLLTGDGRPVLSDLGTARLLGDPDGAAWGTPGYADPDSVSATAAGDVRALAAVGWFALTGQPPDADPAVRSAGAAAASATGIDSGLDTGPPDEVRAALLGILDLALDPDGSARPEPAVLAWTIWEAVRPAPVRLALPAGPTPAPARDGDTVPRGPGLAGPDDVTHRIRVEAAAAPDPQPDRGRLLRRAMLPAGVSVLLAGAALGAVQAFGPPGQAAPGPVLGPVLPADPAGLVRQFTESRAEAFGTASAAPLSRVDEPGSPALRSDTELVRRLRSQGLTLAGLSFTVTGARLLPAAGTSPPTVTVAATVRTSAHRQVRADGTVVATVPAGPATPVRLVLAAGAGGWRVRATA